MSIPFTVLGGYLGAGKTTLVNHLLTNAQGERLALIINDFGAINIDAELISEQTDEQINLTPMLDVVFIMLIFFIVTATFVKEIGLDVNQPDQDKPKTIDPDKKSIVVRITNRDRIIIAQRDVDWRAVRANIERLHAENPEAPVIIQPHPESTTESMIHVMDSARQAGVFNVSLASN